MKNQKVLPIVQGAMMAAIYGVFGILNTYTGSTFDILISYVMVLPMAWYAYEYPIKYTISVYFTSVIIIFICGLLTFWAFSIPTLLLGIFYGIYKKRSGKHMLLWLCCVSAIKNSVAFVVFASISGISVYSEGKEIYEWVINLLPFVRDVISIEVSFVLLFLLIFICEAYCIMKYGDWFLYRIIKKK